MPQYEVYDNLDFERGAQAFLNTIPARRSMRSVRVCSQSAANNRTVLIMEGLMDSVVVPYGEHRDGLQNDVVGPERGTAGHRNAAQRTWHP